MTEQLFRWVKASERLPEKKGKENSVVIECKHPGREFITSGFRNFSEKHPAIYMELGSLSFLTTDGKWDFHSTVPVDSIYWLEPYTPSLNAGSLEEAAKNRVVQTQGKVFYGDALRQADFLAGAAYVKGGEEKGLTKEEIAQICEMADNDYAAQEAILFAEFLRKNNMGPNGFGGWGGGDINTNYYGSTEVKLYELFKKRPLASRPSLDIDKVVEQLRKANPYDGWMNGYEGYTRAISKLQELLNQKEGK